MANDPKSDEKQGKHDTEGHPVVKPDDLERREKEEKESDGPTDPE